MRLIHYRNVSAAITQQYFDVHLRQLILYDGLFETAVMDHSMTAEVLHVLVYRSFQYKKDQVSVKLDNY